MMAHNGQMQSAEDQEGYLLHLEKTRVTKQTKNILIRQVP